jgi:hypothetical protein
MSTNENFLRVKILYSTNPVNIVILRLCAVQKGLNKLLISDKIQREKCRRQELGKREGGGGIGLYFQAWTLGTSARISPIWGDC